MRIAPSQTTTGIVLVGSFNPAIFNPDWLLRHDLVGQTAYDDAVVDVIAPEIAKFKIGPFEIGVVRTKLQIAIDQYPMIQIKDLSVKLLGDLLPHSLADQVGINFGAHFKVGSEKKRNAIGRILAPLEPWGEWSAGWANNPSSSRSGVINMSIVEMHHNSPEKRQTTAMVQPSTLISQSAGIFVGVNDQFDVEDHTGRTAAKIISKYFDESVQRSEWIIDQVMALKDRADA